MKRYAFAIALAASIAAAPAGAQSISGIFAAKGDRVVAKPAHLSFPKTIGALSVTGTDEFSHKGEMLDNGIQYRAANGIWATVYLYLPGYPDAALAAYETDRILPMVYGQPTMRTAQGVVPFAGVSNGAIRYTYAGAARDGKPLATASAFARVGGWIVKIRVSGPATLQKEVEASLDTVIAAGRLEGKARVFPVAAPDFALPCPAAASGKVALAKDDNALAGALVAAMGNMPSNDTPKGGDKPLPPSFPANGLTKMCVRGSLTMGDRTMAVFQPAGTDKPDAIVVMLADNGDLIAIARDLVGDNYTITKAEIGKLTVAGAIDRMPDNDELLRLFKGELPDALKVRATTTFTADGNSNMAIAMPAEKK